jgi:hypothetical protein
MGFNLGAFAGGLATGAMKTYTTLKEQERLEGIEARDKERFENERLKLQQEKEADEQLRQAGLPDSNGVSVKEITNALPIGAPARPDIPPEKQALYKELFGRFTPEQQEQMRSKYEGDADKKAYREKFNEVFGGLTEKQQEAVLRGYGKVALPDSEGATMDVSLGDKGVYTDQSGTRRVGALETDEKKLLENRKRIAAQSGNPIAIKRAEEAETTYLAREASKQTIKKTGYELGSLERKKLYDQKVDEYSDKQVEIGNVLNSLAKADLKAVPDLVNKQLGAFGLTASYTPAEGDNPPTVQLNRADGTVEATFGSSAEIQAALNAHMDDFHASMAKDLVQFLPDPKERIAAVKDIISMASEKARLGFEGRRTSADEDRVIIARNELGLKQKEFEQRAKTDLARLELEFKNSTREDQRLDLAKKIADTQEANENTRIGFEASRLEMDKDFGKKRLDLDEARKNIEDKRATTESSRSEWEKTVAQDRQKSYSDEITLNRDKFREEQKFTPYKQRELDAHIKYYNSEAKYREAAAKELGNGNWKVLGTDKDGQPISMDSQTGKFARADGKPIQDIDFFRKITGVAPDKATFTAKDLLEFTQVYGDTVVKQANGKAVKIRDLPPNEQAAQARAFFSGTGAVGSGGLDSSFKPEAGPTPAPTSALPTTAARPVVTTLGADTARQGLPVTPETAQAGAAAGVAIRDTVGGAARAIDTSMNDAGTLFLRGKIARKEPLNLLEQAQAKRAGLLAP